MDKVISTFHEGFPNEYGAPPFFAICFQCRYCDPYVSIEVPASDVEVGDSVRIIAPSRNLDEILRVRRVSELPRQDRFDPIGQKIELVAVDWQEYG